MLSQDVDLNWIQHLLEFLHRESGRDHLGAYQPYSLTKDSISAKLSPISLWIFLTQDLAEFSTLGVPKGS